MLCTLVWVADVDCRGRAGGVVGLSKAVDCLGDPCGRRVLVGERRLLVMPEALGELGGDAVVLPPKKLWLEGLVGLP